MKKLSVFLVFTLVLAAPLMAANLGINNPIASAKELPPRPPVASKPLSEEPLVGGQIFPIITEAHETAQVFPFAGKPRVIAQVFPFDNEVQSVIPGNPTHHTKASVGPLGGKINFLKSAPHSTSA